jgi:hypothetical protein
MDRENARDRDEKRINSALTRNEGTFTKHQQLTQLYFMATATAQLVYTNFAAHQRYYTR